MRSSLTDLQQLFPSFTYPEHMTDEDELWLGGEIRGRETEQELLNRTKNGIDEVMSRSETATCR